MAGKFNLEFLTHDLEVFCGGCKAVYKYFLSNFHLLSLPINYISSYCKVEVALVSN